jgi:general secretion pathway protein L
MLDQLQSLYRVHIPDFCRWWASELLALMPHALRSRLAGLKAGIKVSVDGENLDAFYAPMSLRATWERQSGVWLPVEAATDLRALVSIRHVDLMVPDDHVLYQEVTLPLAARENLQSTVLYGLSTWSPFRPDEVYIAARNVRATDQKIVVGICYVLREKVSPLLHLAGEAGLPPDRLVFDQDGLWIADLRTAKGRKLAWRRRIDAVLIVSCLSLFLILGIAISWRQAEELRAYQNAVRQELNTVKQDETTRKSLDQLTTQKTAVARRRGTQPSVSALLAGLGEKLPTAAILTSIEIENGRGRMEISGVDGQELIKSLQNAPQISSPKFDSTIPGRPLNVIFGIREKTP